MLLGLQFFTGESLVFLPSTEKIKVFGSKFKKTLVALENYKNCLPSIISKVVSKYCTMDYPHWFSIKGKLLKRRRKPTG